MTAAPSQAGREVGMQLDRNGLLSAPLGAEITET